MRIGIDTHAAEQDGSGNCTYIRNLVKHLIKIDRENDYVLFVTDHKHPFYATLPKQDNVYIHPIPGKPAGLRVFFSLPIAASRQKIDLLHVQYFAPLFHRGKLVLTIHDLIPFRHPQHFSFYERMLFKVFLPWSARRASRILTVSDTSKKDLIHFLNLSPERIEVTYDGVDPNIAFPDSNRSDSEILNRHGLTQDFLLSVGRIDSRKNLIRLIEAFAYLKSEFRVEHKLVIVGKVHYEREKVMSKIVSLGLDSEILMTGYIDEQELMAFYRSATALVLISEFEGFGLPALESMAQGTPVVASDIPVFREILKDSCLFVNPSRPQEVAQVIQELLSNPQQREFLKQKGLELAAHFTWTSTARSTLEAYRTAAKE